MHVKLPEGLHVVDPFIDAADSFTDQIRKTWVAAVKPAARSHTVSLVLNFAGVESVEFRENRCLEELSVKGGDTVDSMRAHDGHVCHTDFLVITLLNQTEP